MYTLVGPWPPQRSVAACVARDLVRHGGETAGLATRAPDPEYRGEVFPLDPDDPARWPGDRRLYHFDDHPDHAFAIPLFLRAPGVVALHAPSLHRLAQTADADLPGFFRREIGGIADADALEAIWRKGLKRPGDALALPCLGWLAAAQAIIVPSRAIQRRVGSALPGVPLHAIAHPIALPTRDDVAARRARARQAQGFAQDAFVVAVTGQPLRGELIDLIAAMASIGGAIGPVGLILAARPAPGDIADQAGAVGVGLRWADAEDFDPAAADILVAGIDPTDAALRTVHAALALGIAVIGVGALLADDLPSSCYLGVAGVGELVDAIAQAREDVGGLRARREQGRALVDAVARPATVARAYLDVIDAA